MSIKVGRYIGTIASGSGLYESLNGTLGFQVLINTEDGATDYTIWLTEKNADRAKRDFETLGIDPSVLKTPETFAHAGELIEGKEISLETGENTYQNKTRIKVKWISLKKDAGVGSLEQRAASLFGGPKPVQGVLPSTTAPEDADDDVPFRSGR